MLRANNLRNPSPSVLLPQQTADTTSRGQARHRSAMTMNVDEEIERLRAEIERLGAKQPDGSIVVKFGTLFNDERCANIFEALVGTLRAAKKRKIVKFDSEMLFQGVHDNVDVVLLPKIVEPVAQPAVEAAP